MKLFRTSAQRAWRPLTAAALMLGLSTPIWSAATVEAQDALPVTASTAPEGTVLYSEFDLDFEGETWQQTEALLAQVGVPDALDLWRDEILRGSAESGDFSEADLDALLGGEMAFIVTPRAVEYVLEQLAESKSKGDSDEDTAGVATPLAESNEDGYGMAAVLLPGDPDAAWDYAQRQIDTYAQERDLEIQTESENGVELIWSEPAPGTASSDDHGDGDAMEMFGDPSGDSFATGRAGDYIIAALSVADVRMIADVIEGGAPSLAESDAAQEIISELPVDAISLTFVDAQGIVEALDPETMALLESFMPENMPSEAWGEYVGMALSANPEGFRFDSITTVADGVDLSAIMVENDPAVVEKAGQVPAGTFVYTAGTLPPGSFASAAYSVAQSVNAASSEAEWSDQQSMADLPTPEEVDAEIAAAAEILGFDPAAELFDILGAEFVAFSSFPGFSGSGFGLDAVVAISTTDPATLAETMQKAAAWVDRTESSADISIRRIGEDTVYVASDPESGDVPSVEFGVVGDQALIAIGDGIEQLNTEPTASLADDEQYQLVMGMLPAEYYQVAYVDISQAMGPIMMLSAGMGDVGEGGIVDADLACTEYANQEEAQAALDSDAVDNADLDLDYDGMACEDAFGSAAGTPVVAPGSLESIRALAMVSYQDGDSARSSALLYIAEPGS